MLNFKDTLSIINSANDDTHHSVINRDLSSHDIAFAESSIYSDTIIKINELADDRLNASIKLYRTIHENDSDIAILESFSEYYAQASDIIKESMRFMEDKLDEFDDYMRNFISNDKNIQAHREKLKNNIKFYKDDGTHEDYTYVINGDIPNKSALRLFDANLFTNVISPQVNDLSVNSFRQAIEAIDIEQDYRKFRGAILGTNDELSISEFGRAVFRAFRNNSHEEKLIIDTESAKNIIEEWFDYSYVSRGLHAELKAISNAFDNILNQIAKVSKNNNNMDLATFTGLLPGDIEVEYVDGHEIDNYAKILPGDLMLQIDSFCKIKLDQLQMYTNIVIMVFSAKLDAIKAKYEQNRMIILDICRALDNPAIYQIDFDSSITKPNNVNSMTDKQILRSVENDIRELKNQ